MYTTNQIGSGHRYLSFNKDAHVMLNNEPIDSDMVKAFMSTFPSAIVNEVKIEFSNRITRRRWGTAWSYARRIVLYRHVAGVFLHELAHILTPGHRHDFIFARQVRQLFEQWLTWKQCVVMATDAPKPKRSKVLDIILED